MALNPHENAHLQVAAVAGLWDVLVGVAHLWVQFEAMKQVDYQNVVKVEMSYLLYFVIPELNLPLILMMDDPQKISTKVTKQLTVWQNIFQRSWSLSFCQKKITTAKSFTDVRRYPKFSNSLQ